MLANSQTAVSRLTSFASVSPWQSVAAPALDRASLPEKLAIKDTLFASAFLCGYVAFYLAVGFLGLAAVERVWAYLAN